MLHGELTIVMQEEKEAPGGGDSIISDLKEVQGEYVQLSELEEMEHDYAEKLVQALKEVQGAVDEVVPIERSALGPSYRYAKEAYLGNDGLVILMNNNGISTSIPLRKFKSGEILSIIQSVVPHLKKAIALRRKEVAQRVELLEHIFKEMKKTGATGTSAKRVTPEYQAPVEEDLVSSSLSGQ
jgi:hypothetical protein